MATMMFVNVVTRSVRHLSVAKGTARWQNERLVVDGVAVGQCILQAFQQVGHVVALLWSQGFKVRFDVVAGPEI